MSSPLSSYARRRQRSYQQWQVEAACRWWLRYLNHEVLLNRTYLRVIESRRKTWARKTVGLRIAAIIRNADLSRRTWMHPLLQVFDED